MRTIVIGDIHGCCDLLCRLLESVSPAEDDRLIFLGDLFDRGPSSFEVFETIRNLERRFQENFILLRGNHEDYLLQEDLSPELRFVWEQVGRPATVESFRSHGWDMEDTIPWLESHCRLFYREDRFQCVHAGIRKEPIETNDTHTLLHDHHIVLKNQYRGKLTITGHIALDMPMWFPGNDNPQILPLYKKVPLPDHGVICIDTGCGKGGLLTAMIIENDSFLLYSV